MFKCIQNSEINSDQIFANRCCPQKAIWSGCLLPRLDPFSILLKR